MVNAKNKKFDTNRMTMGAILTALVIVFQLLASFTAFFGPFSGAVALIPIAIGAVLCGASMGAWLGFVFGLIVIMSGGANLFLMFDVTGTIITVLVKGIMCGFISGLVYKLLKKWNSSVATISASIVCPIINTGLFLLGCFVFFMDDAVKIAETLGSVEIGFNLFIGMAFGNFIFELGMNALLSPIILRLINIRKHN